jgi:hypothetical protein
MGIRLEKLRDGAGRPVEITGWTSRSKLSPPSGNHHRLTLEHGMCYGGSQA